MFKKKVIGLFSVLLLSAMLMLAFNIQLGKSEPPTIIVPDDYEKIQWAVGNASAGETIFVRAGRYYENVTLDKPVSLIGENKYTAIIDANGSLRAIFIRSNGVSVSGFTLMHSYGELGQTGGGLIVGGVGNIQISDIITRDNDASWGIHLTPDSYNVNITRTVILGKAKLGGLLLHGTRKVNVSNNNITVNSNYGICLHFSSNNTISENNITNNDRGITLTNSSNNTITGNNITNNNYGVWLANSSNNFIHHNNLIHNAEQVYDCSWEHPETVPSVNTWDDGYPSGGNYWSDYNGTDLYRGPYQNQTGSDGIGDTPYVIDANNQDNYPLMKPYPWAPHDIGITNVDVSKTVVGQGYNLNINLTIFNYGNNTENFNVTAYATTTIIATFTNIALPSRNSTTITFTWNTTGFTKGNYTISAYAEPVPDETDTTDNTLTDGWIIVSILGDITGDDGWPDGKVDMIDIRAVAKQFGLTSADPEYNPNYDVVYDLVIDMIDIRAVVKHFGETDP